MAWFRCLWRRPRSLLMLMLMLPMALPSPATAARAPLRVVLDDNYPPYIFRDGEGLLQGILVDEWRLWQERTGVPVILDAMDWGEAKRRMETGAYDVIDTIFRTPERVARYDFTAPYVQLEVPAFFRSQIEGISSPATLHGFPVAVKSGDAAIELLQQAGITTLIEYPNYEAIIQAAAAGKISVFVIDRPPALFFLHKYGLAAEFRQSPPFAVGQFHRAVRKGDAATLALVENGFARISAEEHAGIVARWQGAELPGRPMPRSLLIGGGLVVLAALLLLAWTVALRRSVRSKTRDLAASEARFRALFEAIPELVFRLDRQGTFLDYHAATAEQLLLRPEAFIGRTLAETLPEEVACRAMAALTEMLRARTAQHFDYTLNFPDGTQHWYEALMTPCGAEDALVTVRDITERKAAEVSLQRSEQQFATLFANMGEGVAMHELLRNAGGEPVDYRIVDVNRSYETILGLHRGDVVGRLGSEIYGSDAPPYLGEFSLAALSGRPCHLETYFTPMERHFDISIVPWGSDGFATIFADITTRKRIEGVLRQERNRLRMYLQTVEAIIVCLDTDGLITMVNPKGCRLLGYAEEELLGHNWFDICLPQPEGREVVYPYFRKAMVEGLESEEYFENQVVTRDGTLRLIAWHNALLCDDDGQVIGALSAGEDITARKQADEDLRTARDAAEAASRAKSEFLATMSHEIRTPLNGINGMTQLLQLTPLNDKQREYLEVLQTSADNLLALINDILDLARIEAGKLTIEEQLFAPRECIDEVVSAQRHAILQKGLQALVTIDAACPAQVRGDALRFKQILLNLLGNAVKFTERGSVEIRVRVEDWRPERVRLRVSVADTGIGMSEELQQRLFAPFEQGDAALTRKYGGSGLGLSICKRLVQMMGGQIEIESILGCGSTFHVLLPFAVVAAAHQAGHQPVLPAPLPSSRALRVLVAEDNDVNRRLLEILLQQLGHQPVSAVHGRQAVELWQQADFDLVLMDIQMPVMDGIEALQWIREQELARLGRRQPVVALTAHAMAGDRERLLSKGFDGYLAKPFNLVKLVEVLAVGLPGGPGRGDMP